MQWTALVAWKPRFRHYSTRIPRAVRWWLTTARAGIGFVTDSPMRDLVGIQDVGLAAWCNGLNLNSPYANGPGCVGFDASVGGQLVPRGDIIVADIDGVVVVPHARIDRVIAKLDSVRAAETAMEAKVKSEFSEHSRIIQMLTDGRAVMED